MKDVLNIRAGENFVVHEIRGDAEIRRLSSGLLVPYDADVIRVQRGHNKLTTAGINWMRDRINGGAADTMGYMARGTSSTAETAGDTALVAETERHALVSTVVSSAQIAYQYLEPQGSNNGQVFREAGLFNQASGGTMLNRWTYSTIEKNSTKQILYSVVLTISEG